MTWHIYLDILQDENMYFTSCLNSVKVFPPPPSVMDWSLGFHSKLVTFLGRCELFNPSFSVPCSQKVNFPVDGFLSVYVFSFLAEMLPAAWYFRTILCKVLIWSFKGMFLEWLLLANTIWRFEVLSTNWLFIYIYSVCFHFYMSHSQFWNW